MTGWKCDREESRRRREGGEFTRLTELLKLQERRLYILHREATPLIDVKTLHMLVLYLDIQIPGHGDSIQVAERAGQASQVEGEEKTGHTHEVVAIHHIHPE